MINTASCRSIQLPLTFPHFVMLLQIKMDFAGVVCTNINGLEL